MNPTISARNVVVTWLVALLCAPAAMADLAVNELAGAQVIPAEIEPQTGNTYFTRYTLRYEKGRHLTTNYARGAVLPINSEVELLKTKKNKMTISRVDTGEKIVIENVDGFTMRTLDQIARELLSAERTPLDAFDKKIAGDIRNGELRLGMTKLQTILARGYPPSHKTPSLEGDRWVYWSSRYVNLTLVFEDGKLARGRGLE